MLEGSTKWNNNYLCTNRDIGLTYVLKMELCRTDLKCVGTIEPYDPNVWWWQDNALCLPVESTIERVWSFCGPVRRMNCLRLFDAESAKPFHDNHLCWKGH